MLPERFGFLRDLLARYGIDDLQVEHVLRDFVGKIGPDQVSELAWAYNEIRRREDALGLSEFVVRAPPEEWREPDYRSVFILFLIFEELARQRVQPFASREVRLYEVPEPPPDWSKLPAELVYLAAPAERYGVYQFDDEAERFIDRMTPDEFAELRLLRDRIRTDAERIGLWQSQHRMTEHREAELLHFLFAMLDRLGL